MRNNNKSFFISLHLEGDDTVVAKCIISVTAFVQQRDRL